MKIAFIALMLSLPTFTAFAATGLKAGDQAPCVSLNEIRPDHTESAGCMNEPLMGSAHSMVLLEFSSIYCGYCDANRPTLAMLAQKHADKLTVRAVFLDKVESEIRQHLAAHEGEYSFPVSLDLNRNAKKVYGVSVTPTHFLIDAQGTILKRIEGQLDAADVAAIEKAIDAP